MHCLYFISQRTAPGLSNHFCSRWHKNSDYHNGFWTLTRLSCASTCSSIVAKLIQPAWTILKLPGSYAVLKVRTLLLIHHQVRLWVIDNKLSERSQWMSQQDVTDGLGLPFAAAKFLCHPKKNPSRKAFMWIYLQIPVIDTQYQSSQIWRQQAADPQPHVELTTWKHLRY